MAEKVQVILRMKCKSKAWKFQSWLETKPNAAFAVYEFHLTIIDDQ